MDKFFPGMESSVPDFLVLLLLLLLLTVLSPFRDAEILVQMKIVTEAIDASSKEKKKKKI